MPTGSGDSYRKAAGWKRFGIIEERTFTGVEQIADVSNDITIQTGKGGISLSCEQPCLLSIFNIDGTLNGNYSVTDGTEIPLPKGMFLVRTPIETHKIFIK